MATSEAFVRGYANVFNLFGIRNDRFDTQESALLKDYEAIKGDWENVGKDIWKAANSYKQQATK